MIEAWPMAGCTVLMSAPDSSSLVAKVRRKSCDVQADTWESPARLFQKLAKSSVGHILRLNVGIGWLRRILHRDVSITLQFERLSDST